MLTACFLPCPCQITADLMDQAVLVCELCPFLAAAAAAVSRVDSRGLDSQGSALLPHTGG